MRLKGVSVSKIRISGPDIAPNKALPVVMENEKIQRNLLKTLKIFVLGYAARIAEALTIRKVRLRKKSMRHRQPLEF